MLNLYERIEQLCKAQGINVTEMCRRAGVSRGILSDLKMGRQSGLGAVNAEKIASYLGVSVSYLLGKTEEPNPRNTLEASQIEEMLKDEQFKAFYERVIQLTPDDIKLLSDLADKIITRDSDKK